MFISDAFCHTMGAQPRPQRQLAHTAWLQNDPRVTTFFPTLLFFGDSIHTEPLMLKTLIEARWLIITALCVTYAQPSQAQARWFKGNTHCHTSTSSDSSTPIEDLMSWYKGNGYDFIVVTDHNQYTTQSALNSLTDSGGRAITDDSFIIIPGEELTTSAHHINGLDLPMRLGTASTISASFELVWSSGGLPQLNHPEYNYIRSSDIIEEISEMDGPMFLEVFNSHPIVVQRSGPSSEDIWDGVLSTGRMMWGVAVDDAHTLVDGDKPPGGGFIYVEADSLDNESIMSAMAAGRFYASSGARLENFSHTRSLYDVDAPGATEIVFISQGGAVLERVSGEFASYSFRGDEVYVRARVESPEGFAWTQPVFIDGLPPNAPPIAAIEASATSGMAPLNVQFDARESSDSDGQIVSHTWNFGDGGTGRGEVILHSFAEPGVYSVELTVFDDQGAPGRENIEITVLDDQGVPGPAVVPEPEATDPTPDAAEPDNGPAAPDGDPSGFVSNVQPETNEGCTIARVAPRSATGATFLLVGAALLLLRRSRREESV